MEMFAVDGVKLPSNASKVRPKPERIELTKRGAGSSGFEECSGLMGLAEDEVSGAFGLARALDGR